MYTELCRLNDWQPEKEWLLRKIFNTEFNLKFHKPRKDWCDKCFICKNATPERQLQLQEEHDIYLGKKMAALNFQNESAMSCKSDINFIEFDLEAVRYRPSIPAKGIFYKRRFAVYNQTIYDVSSTNAACYMWHEGLAGRVFDEVGSCLWNYLKENANGIPCVLMSDTCSAQNRNIFVTALLLHAVIELNIPSIDQCFVEPGHSMMECDSVHSRIETATENLEIFDPAGWHGAVKQASRKGKYSVIEVWRAGLLQHR